MKIQQNSPEKRLTALFSALSAQDRHSLLNFAEFLYAQQQPEPTPAVLTPPQPQRLPRPTKESVVAAIKRLSSSYPMLDKAKMLNDTASLMSQHLMQGREAQDVINELEAVFIKHYQAFCQDFNSQGKNASLQE